MKTATNKSLPTSQSDEEFKQSFGSSGLLYNESAAARQVAGRPVKTKRYTKEELNILRGLRKA